ncbi:right-handed parallel beta-helix repeat-containing protein [Haloarcula onubensis]|uniref:Right-handed parallel beta-helix repeat-containing protein n=1 Tax=Haloarcula onubensis TaxID=2950539 RepID=A0ABU2FLG7_9EURY|nr:right-handed parallel beta-helix repeat-containing protein [Halomicroarcula sp. S3CR25-11]MDS0281598.1 right-handed parallel beta-helix repeat-containing protein [Halomicroarcula sp. S3CR25-11]
MATLNVQDYGAVGDGNTDDTAAINDAIADAGTGDTVLIPATADHYLVSTSNRAAVDFTGVADGVTITGEGPGSVLKMDDVTDGKNQWVLGAEADSGALSGVTIRRLTLDGSREVNGAKSTAGFNLYPGGGGHDVRIEDVVAENCAGTGISNRGASEVTLRRVTSRNNGQHGFDFTGDDQGTATDGRSLKAVDNDGTGLDFHNGDHVVEDVYCDSNRSGTKMGNTGGDADSVVLRNANLRNARENSGFRETMDDNAGTDVTLDTVQVIDAALHGFRLSNSANYTITEILTDGTGYGPQNRAPIYITDSASIDADVVRVQNSDYGPGIRNSSPDSSSVSEYYHFDNPGGAIEDNTGTLSVGSRYNQESGELDVPGANDVGAFTTTTTEPVDDGTDSSTETPATYRTNFSAYEMGAVPNDWTPEHASDDGDWATVAERSPAGSAVLRFDSDTSARHALSYDQVGTASDVEVLGLVRVSELSRSPTAGGRLFLRGSGTAGAESGYFVNVRDSRFGVWKYDGGGSARLVEWGQPTDGQWYFVRFSAAGDRLRARVWPADADEPTEWDADVTDGALRSGWVGLGSYSEFADDWGYLSVGVGGESAPLPDTDTADPSLNAVIQTIDGTIQTG